MKRLILLRGPMGVGKTAVGRELQKLLPDCAFLDGDWCWDIRPFTVDEETKAMVLDNIRHMLTGYLRCGAVENIIFAWVMQEKEIVDAVCDGLPLSGVELHCFTLTAAEVALTTRLQRDIASGLRTPDILPRSLSYLPKFTSPVSKTIDTTNHRPAQTARELLRRITS